jgi:hypothetical protein
MPPTGVSAPYVNPAYAAVPASLPASLPGRIERDSWRANHVSWGAVFAGIAAALLTQLVLSLVGLGVGLAAFQITGNTADNPTVAGMSQGAAIWWIVSGIIASFVGGLTAGRLSGSERHSTAGWHGFVAWCGTTIVVLWLLSSALGGVVGGAFSALGSTLQTGGSMLGGVAANATKGADTDSLEARVRRLVNPNDAQSAQDSIVGWVRASLGSDQKAADDAKARAVDALSHAANISPDEATNRLNQLQAQAKQAADQAKQAAEQARKVTAEGALFAVAALLFGMIAGIVGGGLGTPRRLVALD